MREAQRFQQQQQFSMMKMMKERRGGGGGGGRGEDEVKLDCVKVSVWFCARAKFPRIKQFSGIFWFEREKERDGF